MSSEKKVRDFRRRSMRLQEFDYSRPGMYFITICVHERECLFGKIVGGDMTLNEVGSMIADTWHDLPLRFPFMEIDEFVVMPNHIHGITSLDCRGEPCVRPILPSGGQRREKNQQTPSELGEHKVRPYNPTVSVPPAHGTMNGSLGRIIQTFKSITTLRYVKGVKNRGWKVFSDKLWQRNYYEHVIRNEAESNLIREYIINNPLQWELDHENPEGKGTGAEEPWALPQSDHV